MTDRPSSAGTDRSSRLAAGPFAQWLGEMQAALAGDAEADVPCGACTACCRSAQFVHIAPDETDTLRHLPAGLLFPAPGRPDGHVLMGHDRQGRCPMLTESGCSVYEHRPRTCRTYDCRVFAAAGLEPADQPEIAAQVGRWEFSYPTAADRTLRDAVRAAARYVGDRADEFGDHVRPRTPGHLAVTAVVVHGEFVAGAEPDPVDLLALLDLRRTGQHPGPHTGQH